MDTTPIVLKPLPWWKRWWSRLLKLVTSPRYSLLSYHRVGKNKTPKPHTRLVLRVRHGLDRWEEEWYRFDSSATWCNAQGRKADLSMYFLLCDLRDEAEHRIHLKELAEDIRDLRSR